MFRVTKELEFCFGHRLMDYPGKCRQIHGHNAVVHVVLEAAELDAQGMVVDFVAVKRSVARWIDETLDHKLILHRLDPLIPDLKRHGMPVVEMDGHPSTENMAKLIFEFALSAGFPVVEVTLWETPTSFASYRLGTSQKDIS